MRTLINFLFKVGDMLRNLRIPFLGKKKKRYVRGASDDIYPMY
jgi:hypothetical protein